MQHTYTHKNWKKLTVLLEGCGYTISYNPETEKIIVHQPAKVIVGYRNTIGNHFPEIRAYDGIGLEPALAQMLIMEKPKSQHLIEGDGTDVRMPKCLTTVKKVELGGSTFTIAYDWNTDLIAINVPELEVHTHRKVLEVGISELRVLHGGRLLEEIKSFIFAVHQDELGFNPEDVF